MKSLVVAKVLLVGPDEKVLVIRRSEDDALRPGEFDIPGGHTDKDEYGNEAGARETQEEVGITVEPRQLRLVYSEAAIFADRELSVVWLLFIGKSSETEVRLSSEHVEYRWVTLDGAIELLDYDRQKRMLMHVRDNGLLDG